MKTITVKFSGSINFSFEDTFFERFSNDDIDLVAKNLLKNIDVNKWISKCEVEHAD